MQFHKTPLSGLYVVEPEKKSDDRGFLMRTYCKREFEVIAGAREFVQMNHTSTTNKGTIRGLHFQVRPNAEAKLVRCVKGRILDVAVDLRRGSGTFLAWFGLELSEANCKMLYIPEGFAHGFQALEHNCELLYCHSQYYEPSAEGGLRFDDPKLGIIWPLAPVNISSRDTNHPLITDDYRGMQV